MAIRTDELNGKCAEQNYIWLHDLKGNHSRTEFTTPFEPVRAAQAISGIKGSLD